MLKRLIVIVFLISLGVMPVFASECNEGDPELDWICREKERLVRELDNLHLALEGAEKSLSGLNARLETIKADLVNLASKLEKTEAKILAREEALGQQKLLFNNRVRHFYKRSQHLSPLVLLLSSQSAASFTRELSYRLSATNEDKKVIINLSSELKQLAEDKEAFQKNKDFLAFVKKEVDAQAASLQTEIKGAKDYEAQITQKIAQLSSRQREILAAREGTFTTSVGDVPVSNIPCSGPPGSPTYCNPGGGDWFAAFSFGAWTHRKGMSQYGAKGRAEAGQSMNDILQAYYGKTPVNKDTSGTILVDGYGALDFENYYLLGIAEMPGDWHPEALKAQAIAARSYAYRYKIENRSICATQSCQVFLQSKANAPPDGWRQAVEATRGQVIEEVTTYYSSTAGGYLTYPDGKWDTTDGQGGAGFADRAWESKAGSPWFYAAWFTQSYVASSAKCNHSHPWLSSAEMADILNAWQVLKNQGTDERVLPVTINQCPLGGNGGNPYSVKELESKAASLGGAFNEVNSVSVVYGGNGETNSLKFETNKGSISVSGSEFKQAFNLRAPGYIAIRSPLFNIEKK